MLTVYIIIIYLYESKHIKIRAVLVILMLTQYVQQTDILNYLRNYRIQFKT